MIISDLSYCLEIIDEGSAILGGEDILAVVTAAGGQAAEGISASSSAGIKNDAKGKTSVEGTAKVSSPEQVSLELDLDRLLADLF